MILFLTLFLWQVYIQRWRRCGPGQFGRETCTFRLHGLYSSFFFSSFLHRLIFWSSFCPLCWFILSSTVLHTICPLPPHPITLTRVHTHTIKARLCIFVSPIVTIFPLLLFPVKMLCHTAAQSVPHICFINFFSVFVPHSPVISFSFIAIIAHVWHFLCCFFLRCCFPFNIYS